MYPSITPLLYGTNLTAPPVNNTVLPGIMNSGNSGKNSGNSK